MGDIGENTGDPREMLIQDIQFMSVCTMYEIDEASVLKQKMHVIPIKCRTACYTEL